MIVFIRNARLSFPDLWHAKAFEEGSTPKFGADIIIEPDTEVLAVASDGAKKTTTLEKVMAAVAKDAWQEKGAAMLKNFENKQKCYREGGKRTNGEGDVYDGYEDRMYITAKNTVRPTVVDQRRNPLSEEHGTPYSGCYITAKIDVYANTKPKTRGIFAQLLGLQFVKDGDPFSGGAVASADDFDEIDMPDASDDDDLL